jgi:hypothetical protein
MNCGKSSVFTIDRLELNPPDVIVQGENVTLTLLYTSPVTVTDGTAKTAITFNFLPISPTIVPLCNSVPCPIEPGQHDGSTTYTYPMGYAGKTTTTITWADLMGAELLCIKMTLTTKLKSILW